MRPVVAALALLGMLSTAPAALAQAGPQAPAVGLTQDIARQRLEAAGYGPVTELRQDPTGAWRGQAMRNGARLDVAVDASGSVIVGPLGVPGLGGNWPAMPPGSAPDVGAEPPGLVAPPAGGGGR